MKSVRDNGLLSPTLSSAGEGEECLDRERCCARGRALSAAARPARMNATFTTTRFYIK
jgi:hypothetical protein